MALMRITSPHAHNKQSTSDVMKLVLLATLPGVLALTVAFGWGTVINILLASIFGLALEALALAARKRPIAFYLKDYSALVTAVLLGIALPPYSAWWILLTGMFFSIIVAKQLYGGLGYNPFNPAMVGYVVLLISFPIQMTTWAAPIELLPASVSVPNLLDSLLIALGFMQFPSVDGFTMATPLDYPVVVWEVVVNNDCEMWSHRDGFPGVGSSGLVSGGFWVGRWGGCSCGGLIGRVVWTVGWFPPVVPHPVVVWEVVVHKDCEMRSRPGGPTPRSKHPDL